MNPLERKIALMKAGVTQARIAQELKVSKPMVSKVVSGSTRSERVRQAIARHIGKPVEIVFPDADEGGSSCTGLHTCATGLTS